MYVGNRHEKIIRDEQELLTNNFNKSTFITIQTISACKIFLAIFRNNHAIVKNFKDGDPKDTLSKNLLNAGNFPGFYS